MKKTQPDYIFTGKFLLPTHQQVDVIKDGGIAVQGDTIIDIDTAESLEKAYPETMVTHEEHGLIMPGLVNAHTHAAMSCFRGLADDLPLMSWLENHIFPVEAKLTPAIVFQSTLLSIAEMIRSGTTSFCDMYLFSREVARAADESGIRAWVGEVLYDFPSPCYGEVQDGIEYLKDMLQEYKNTPRITITTDPHSVYTCSPELLVRLGTIAHEHNSLYVIHLSENEAEVETCMQRYGVRPVKHLKNLELLGPTTLASHCVKLTERDIDTLHEMDVKVAHCVESNMKLASGIAPVAMMLEKGITIAIGTDGSACNNDVDMFSELNSVAKMQKIASMDPTVMNAEETIKAATISGAKALGVEQQIGSLKVGKKADFIVLDLNQPHLTPLYNLPSHLTYVVKGNDVIHTFVGGRQLMKNRNLLTIDEDKLLATMQEMAKKIIQLRN